MSFPGKIFFLETEHISNRVEFMVEGTHSINSQDTIFGITGKN